MDSQTAEATMNTGIGWNKRSNRAERRRPYFALFDFETATAPKLVPGPIRAKEERIVGVLGELETILEDD